MIFYSASGVQYISNTFPMSLVYKQRTQQQFIVTLSKVAGPLTNCHKLTNQQILFKRSPDSSMHINDILYRNLRQIWICTTLAV